MYKIKLIVIICFLILFCLSLSANEGIARQIEIHFTDLRYTNTYEEINAFISDYSQYQLRIIVWYATYGDVPYRAYFIFNQSLISLDDFLEILLMDERVSEVRLYPEWPLPRQFVIHLDDIVNEQDFIDSYSEYGLRGSWSLHRHHYYHWDLEREGNLFLFNDTTIYSGNLLDIIRSDKRVIRADIVLGITDGAVVFSLNSTADFTEFSEDYYFLDIYQNFSWFRGRFNFYLYEDFSVLNLLLTDSRVDYALFIEFGFAHSHFFLAPKEPPVSISDENTLPIINVSAYPNPVSNENVSFKINSEVVNHFKTNQFLEINIFNIRGQKIFSHTFIENSFTWNRKDMNNNEVASGIYFYRIYTDNMTTSGKFLILK